MLYRRSLLLTIYLGALFLLRSPTFAKQEPATAEQVIAKYLEAIGADRFSSVTTVIQRGEVYGNLTNYWSGSRSPLQSQKPERGTFESYFKSPNLRFSSTLTEKHQVVAIHGCDGRVAWYIDAHLRRSEFQPKAGNEYDCEKGFEPIPFPLREASARKQLVKKKEVEGRASWEIKVEVAKSNRSATYYFDAETYLLVRSEELGSTVTYSDYRTVGGIKLPFMTIREYSNSRIVNEVRELRFNAPIDDARFAELKPEGGVVAVNPITSSKTGDSPNSNVGSPKTAATTNSADDSNAPSTQIAPRPNTPERPATGNEASVTEVNFPNFTSCTIAELLLTVPELNKLKPARDQEKLLALLDKVAAKTIDLAGNMPNLVSRETVSESQRGVTETLHDYDYLILPRIQGNRVDLDEFRVDLKTGDKFQTDEVMKDESKAWGALERASQEVATFQSGRPPTSQGFATAWVHFYPRNRSQATFRYLGEQKMGGQHALVLAFAQKPQSVVRPAMFLYQGKSVPIFLQGVAWFDASDFRILRLRSDLLSPIPEVSLHRLTADIQFALTRIEGVALLLSLPREVMVTSEVGGSTVRESHKYSDYRMFRAQSRILVDP